MTRSPTKNTTRRTTSSRVLIPSFIPLALNNKGLSAHPAGVRLNNQKYYTVNYDAEAGTWYAKKEKGGACIAKTKTGVVIGTFSTSINMENGQPQNAGEANKRVLDTAKYLVDNGIWFILFRHIQTHKHNIKLFIYIYLSPTYSPYNQHINIFNIIHAKVFFVMML